MANSLELVINHLISQNNHNMNIAFPAVIISTEKLLEGLVSVQPIVSYLNPLTRESVKYPVLNDIRLIFPSTKNSTFSFPVSQGDYVDILIQSVDVQNFVSGNGEPHEPFMLSHGNLSNAVAIVGFTPYQESCFNPNNYKNEFDNQDLNIVHNKNTDNEAIISINTQGDIKLKSPTKVSVESSTVEVIADRVEANSAVISTQGDVEIQGRSVNQFMLTHTHVGNEGRPTSPPTT